MANRRDSEKIKIIRLIIDRAKRTKVKKWNLLTRNDEFYGKAVRSQADSGIATLICCGIGLVVTMGVYLGNSRSAFSDGSGLLAALICLFILIITAVICYKTSSLLVTPTTMLVLIIIQLIISLFCFSGIIPLIAVIDNIVALVRWSTYRNWYDEVSIDYYKGRRKQASSTRNVIERDFLDSKYDVYDDERKPVGLIAGLIISIVAGIVGCVISYNVGKNNGYYDGAISGYDNGLNEGKAAADQRYLDGRNEGYSQGVQDSNTYSAGSRNMINCSSNTIGDFTYTNCY